MTLGPHRYGQCPDKKPHEPHQYISTTLGIFECRGVKKK